MKAVWMGVAAVSALLMVNTAQASEDLAKSKGCTGCHAMDKPLVGPALKDIAAKYKGKPEAEATLAQKVTKGGGGVWNMPAMKEMPPNAHVTEAESKTLVHWILSLK
jgi:cytochrome c